MAKANSRHAIPTDAQILWQPHSGPQSRFLASSAYEVLYGGQAGGGKTDAILAAPLRWCHIPSFRGVIFRRTFPELETSVIERSHGLYDRAFLGAQYSQGTHTWKFPSGAKVYFRHLDLEKAVHAHQSTEYQYLGFDELTSFSLKQYTYLTASRARSSKGVPIRVRGGTNPGNQGHDWVFRRWAPWLDPESEVKAGPCEVLYFLPDPDGGERWVPRGTPLALSRTFIPASRHDNPTLMQADPMYEVRLQMLDPVTREQLAKGNWLARPAAGVYFNRARVRILTHWPSDVVSTVRYWDFAGTAQKSHKDDPDWTVGTKVGLRQNGRVVIGDVVRFREEPGIVEKLVIDTAAADGFECRIGIEQDPGQAGKFQAHHFISLLPQYAVETYPPTGDKVTRFGPFSAQQSHGLVDVVAGEWNQRYFNELEAFPEGSHDDQVDSTSGAYMMLCEGRNPLLEALERYARSAA